MGNTEIRVLPDAGALATAVAEAFLELVARPVPGGRSAGVHEICLTGGTIADRIHREIARLAPSYDVDWSAVRFWFGDERFVAADSADRNARQARAALLDLLPIPEDNIMEIPAAGSVRDVHTAAEVYADLIRFEGTGSFDLVMLGVGPDGHVASLFPGFPQLDVDDRVAVGVTGSPKPPPERVSLTFPALNRTAAVWVLASGAEKADAVARALAPAGDVHDTPARGVLSGPDKGATCWLDADSARNST